MAIIPLAFCLKDGDFKVISKVIKPNMVFVFYTIGLIFISLPIIFIGKKYSMVIELIIPIYCIYVTIFVLPTWYEKPLEQKRIAKMTLLQCGNFAYIMNFILLFFFNSHYAISVAGRSILSVNCLNMSFRRWIAGDSTLLPPLFNFITTTSIIEFFAFKQN